MKRTERNTAGSVLFPALFTAALIAADQWTKRLAVIFLKGGDPHVLIPDVLEFKYLENRGAAFSMLQGQQLFFYILTAIFLAAAVYVLCCMPRSRRYLPLRICLLVLCAGAAGNLIDRIAHKYVIDFIYFSIIRFPIFNLADIYVSLSVVVLILLILFRYKEEDFSFFKKHHGAGEEKI